MLDVSQEEKVHAGEFETLMEELDPSYEEAEEEGEKEVKDLLDI
jgi:rubrerythrin